MSIETVAWAKLQRCGCPYAKAVLLELANWARPDGICQFRRVRDIAFVVELSERTVQRVLVRLEDNTPADRAANKKEGLNFIRRVESFRADGGQQANGFVLVGYIRGGDYQASPRGETPHGGRPSDRGGDDSAVTPKIDIESEKKDSPKPPPTCKQVIASDWIVPAISNLPAKAKAAASEWPSGAYESEAEAFHQHWIGTGQRRADWMALWASRVLAQHTSIIRAAKSGIRFPATASQAEVRRLVLVPLQPVHSKSFEDERSERLRQLLRQKVNEQSWDRLFEPAAFLFDLPGVKVVVGNTLAQEELESRYLRMVQATAQFIDPEVTWVSFDTEQSQLRRAL
jgi:hypothetical protein